MPRPYRFYPGPARDIDNAMELRADAKFAFPRAVVFAAYRDHLTDLLPYLPNVRKIEQASREEPAPGVVKLLNVWHGGGDIPGVARAFVSEKMLTWDDSATWSEAEFTCEWVIKTHAFSEAVSCRGGNRFIERDGTTVLEIRGNIAIDAKKIPGVPGLLAGKVGKAVEDLLVSKIQPNLVSTAAGLGKFLESRGGKL